MKRLLIACETIQDEIEMALLKMGREIETTWMANNLHAYPEKLRNALQEEIDKVEKNGYDKILFAYGNCGNALVGLGSKTAELIIPKYGDCIDMLLCEEQGLERIRTTTYFLTKGWLKGEMTLDKEYEYNCNKYGEKRAKMIMNMMFRHYKNLMLIDTGAYNIEETMPRFEAIAKLIGLKTVVNKGSITPLEKLLSGNWGTEFLRIAPGSISDYTDFDGVSLRNS
ncbi:MAG: DUF1638 domain-containing protein [Eubacteriaceae bacterium]